MTTKIDNELLTITVNCDGEPKQNWEKCLVLHMIHDQKMLTPVCALVMIAGITHEEAEEALEEMNRRLVADALHDKPGMVQ